MPPTQSARMSCFRQHPEKPFTINDFAIHSLLAGPNTRFRRPAQSILLGQIGSRFSELYAEATTPVGNSFTFQNLIKHGELLAIVECSQEELSELAPYHFDEATFSRDQQKTLGCSRAYFGSVQRWNQFTHVRIIDVRSFRSKQERCLRSGLGRLHAQRQVVFELLRLIGTRELRAEPGSEAAEELRAYLMRSLNWLDRQEITKIPIARLEPIIAVNELGYSKALRVAIKQDLSRITQKLADKAEQFLRRQETHQRRPAPSCLINENNVQVNVLTIHGDVPMSYKTVTIGEHATINAPVVAADYIEKSFNAASELPEDDKRRELLERLVAEVGKLCAKQEPKDASATGRTLEVLVKEIRSEHPRESWLKLSGKGLIEAAQTVAEMAGPITQTVRALLGLFSVVP